MHRRPILVVVCLITVCLALVPQAADALNPKLLKLPPNRWVELHKPAASDWSRQAHAGLAYDSRRGTLLMFGSNTHGLNWDNTVHEFDPEAESWVTHAPEAPEASYRADSLGRAVAGGQPPQPWATHTYAGLAYDPQRDGLIVAAQPDHNPIIKKIPDAKIHPTWFYSQARHQWQMLPDSNQPPPRFFGAAAAYDERRGIAVAYHWGIWELLPEGPGRDGSGTTWVRVSKENHHHLHYSLVYDSRRGNFAVFGDYQNSNEVWIYTPGQRPGEAGHWEKRVPGGDGAPRSQAFPVAFDRDQSVFLLAPGNTAFESLPSGRERAHQGPTNSTFVYDPDANRYIRLPDADLPALGMNFMMAYDTHHKVFLLVTGKALEAPTVWAMKLDLGRLQR
jgi:hypothetical protein